MYGVLTKAYEVTDCVYREKPVVAYLVKRVERDVKLVERTVRVYVVAMGFADWQELEFSMSPITPDITTKFSEVVEPTK
jgi:hypothetical protein